MKLDSYEFETVSRVFDICGLNVKPKHATHLGFHTPVTVKRCIDMWLKVHYNISHPKLHSLYPVSAPDTTTNTRLIGWLYKVDENCLAFFTYSGPFQIFKDSCETAHRMLNNLGFKVNRHSVGVF